MLYEPCIFSKGVHDDSFMPSTEILISCMHDNSTQSEGMHVVYSIGIALQNGSSFSLLATCMECADFIGGTQCLSTSADRKEESAI